MQDNEAHRTESSSNTVEFDFLSARTINLECNAFIQSSLLSMKSEDLKVQESGKKKSM